jgi:hypothetical protein
LVPKNTANRMNNFMTRSFLTHKVGKVLYG